MSKKVSLLLALMLVFTLIMAVPAMAGYEYEEVDDGVFEVTFFFEDRLDAGSMHVAGDFNDWSSTHPDWEMEEVDGRWEYTTELDEGIYEYKFVADGGDWITDRHETVEAFADDGVGGENSVLMLVDTALPGELSLSGNMTNELTYLDEDEEVNILNQADLTADGVFYQEIEAEDGEVSRIPLVEYDGTVRVAQDVSDVGSGRFLEEAALDEFTLEDLGVTYMHNLADFTFEANKMGSDSYDYMGLVNAATVFDLDDSRRFDLSSDKWVDANMALTTLTDDITDGDEVNRSIATANLRQSLLNDSLEVGASAVVDSGYDGEDEEYTTETLALFAEFELMDELTARAQFTHVPTVDVGWEIIFDAKEHKDILEEEGFDVDDLDNIRVGVVGAAIDGWDMPEDVVDLGAADEDGVYTNLFPDASEGEDFKIVVKADGEEYDWEQVEGVTTNIGLDDEEAEADGDDMELGDDDSSDYFEQAFDSEELETAQMYLGEINYNIVDEMRSLQESIAAGDDITVYQAEFSAGIEAIAEDAFIPLAGDDLNDTDNFDTTEIFADAKYSITSGIESTIDFSYQKDFDFDSDKKLSAEPGLNASLFDDSLEADASFLFKDEADDEELEAANRRFKADTTWAEPIAPIDHVKLETEFDSEEEDDFDGEKQEIFAELQTGILPLTNHIMLNTTQNLDSEVAGYFAETSLDIPIGLIGYLNAEVFFADDDVTFDENAMRYKVDGQIENIPALGYLLENISAEFEVDKDGIIDAEEYEDDENDWKQRVGASAFLNLPFLDSFHGLTTELEMQNIEEEQWEMPDDLDEDDKYYVADNASFVEWHAGLTFLTGYDITEDFTANLTLKSDLTHGDIISEYEDDALLIELNKELSDVSSFSASYNRRDEDEGEDYVEVLHELQF